MTVALKLSLSLARLGRSRLVGTHIKRTFAKIAQNKPWHFEKVNPFGKLQLSAGTDSFHLVQPFEPVQYPNQDEAIVRCNKPERVHCECNDSQIMVKQDGPSSDGLTFEYQVPLKFDIEARLQDDAGIHIQDMESGCIQVAGEKGSCYLKSVKSDNLQVKTSGPVISHSTLHCNGHIQTTNNGVISLGKALGTSLALCSEAGDISVDSLYVEDFSVFTKSGNITLGSTHMKVSVQIEEKGDLTIGTLDGSLSASVNSGTVKLHITQLDNCDIHLKQGDVELQLSESVATELDISAPSVRFDSQFNTSKIQEVQTSTGVSYKGCLEPDTGNTGKTGTLKIVCDDGKVTLQCKDWFSSLGLKELA